MANSIKKNLGFQTTYQMLNTCLPLITAPYLARVLGVEMLGVFSYTSSVVAYFAIIAMLGTINYGTKSIAAAGNNRDERSRVFWGIYVIQLICSIAAIVLYIGYVFLFCNANILITWIQILTLVSCIFDISWLFFGTESVSLTVLINTVIRILTVLAILLFVKTPSDLWIYALIMLLGTLIGQLILWGFVRKDIDFCSIAGRDIFVHIKPNVILFIPLLAMSVYHIMDKTMLGLLSSYEQTGYYYNADKVINIPLGVLNGVGTVMLPRMTALLKAGNKKEADELFVVSMEGIGLAGVAIACGIAAVSKEFVPIFFGEGYDACVGLIIVMAPVLIIKGFSNTTRIQYLIPYEKESVFTKSVFLGAATNLLINALLIPRFGAMGAVIGTLIAELVACIWQLLYIRKSVNLKQCIISTLVYMAIGFVMFFVVRCVALLPVNIFIKLIFEIIAGGSVFVIISVSYWKRTKNKLYEAVFSNFFQRTPMLRRLL